MATFGPCACQLFPGHIFRRLFNGLRSNFFGDSVLNTFIFFLCNLLSDLAVCWVATQNECVEEGNTDHDAGHDAPPESSERPTNGAQNQVEHESPPRVEKKSKVDSDQDTEEFELGFKTTN